MSKVLRCEGLKHSCAFLIETGPAQTTPIPQTLMLFSVILLNRSWGSWAHKLPPCLSPLKAKNLYPLGCTVWECLTQETQCTGHSFCTMEGGCTLCECLTQETQWPGHSSYPTGGGGGRGEGGTVWVSHPRNTVHSAQCTGNSSYPTRGTVWVSHPRNTVTSHSLNTNIVHWILGPMFSQEYQSNNHLTFTVIWGNRGGLKWFLLSYYLV